MPRASEWIVLSALASAAAAVRWFGLDDHPLWLDEVISLSRASLPPGELIAHSFVHLHYPSYFLLLSGVVSLFGDGNVALRFPSLVFGILCVPLGFSAARRIAGPFAAIATGVLFALSPVLVMYSQEARSYTLVVLLITAAIWGFVRLATDPAEAAVGLKALVRPTRRSEFSARTSWAAWTGGTAGALIVLNVAVFWLAVAVVGMIVLRRELRPDERRRFNQTLLVALAVIAAVWLPWGVALAPTLLSTARNGFWAPQVTFASFTDGIWAVYMFGVAEPLGFERLSEHAPLRALAISSAALAGAYSLRHRPAICWTLLASAALPPLALVLVSVHTPVFVPRYLLAGVPAFLLLAGVGVARLFDWLRNRRSLAALLALGALVDLSSNLLTYHRAEIKPRWDRAALLLADSLHEDDRVLFHDGFARWIVEAKLRRAGKMLSERAILESPDALEHTDFPGRVWVAYGRVGHAAGPNDADIRNWLSAWGEPVEIRIFGRQVRIALFQFSPPATPISLYRPSAAPHPALDLHIRLREPVVRIH